MLFGVAGFSCSFIRVQQSPGMGFHGHLERDAQPLSSQYPILFSSENLTLFEITALFAC